MASDRLVELRAFNVLEEAELVASLLEASGIDCSVRDRYTTGVRELTLALGGVVVMVHERDLAAARELLDADHSAVALEPIDEEEATCAECGALLRTAMEPCPTCNGQPDREIMTPRRTEWAIMRFKAGFILVVLLLFSAPVIWEFVVRRFGDLPENGVKMGLYAIAAIAVLALVVKVVFRASDTRL